MGGRGERLTMHLVLLCTVGCASGTATMDPHAPIDTKRGYSQNGKQLDRQQMLDTLEREPAARDHIQNARGLGTLGMVGGAIGGGLVGFPVGQAIAGEEEPAWVLAGVGAGVVAVSLSISLIADGHVAQAVELHNASLAGSEQAQAAGPAAPSEEELARAQQQAQQREEARRQREREWRAAHREWEREAEPIRERRAPMQVAAWITGATGLALLITGGVLESQAVDRNDDVQNLEDRWRREADPTQREALASELQDLEDQRDTLHILGLSGLIGGGVATATSVVLFTMLEPLPEEPVLSPRGSVGFFVTATPSGGLIMLNGSL